LNAFEIVTVSGLTNIQITLDQQSPIPNIITLTTTTVPAGTNYSTATVLKWLNTITSFGANFCNSLTGWCPLLQNIDTSDDISGGIGSNFCANGGCPLLVVADLSDMKTGSVGDGFCQTTGCQSMS